MIILSWRQIPSVGVFLCMISIFSGCLRSDAPSEESLHISNISFDEQTWPVVIIGGGMAGLTAAVYCTQANIPCLVIEGPKPGGALGQSHSVRNWPGVMNAPGLDIVGNVRKQAEAGGAKIIQENVSCVDFKQWPRIIQTDDSSNPSAKKNYKALSVIIAMGTEPTFLNVPGETGKNSYWGKGVGNCATCEGSLYRGKDVAIVGGGDAAMEEANYLAGIARKVTLLVRKDFFRANDIKNRDKTLAMPNVEVKFNTEVKEMIGDGTRLTKIVLCNNVTNEKTTMPIDGLFLAIGSSPNTKLFKQQLELDARDFIVLKNFQETSVRGVYAAGDVSDYEFVQAVTAASDGCKSALQAIRFLKESGFENSMVVGKEQTAQTGQADKETQTEQKAVEPEKAEPLATENVGHEVTEIATEKDFQDLVKNNTKPVVIDIYSTWCGPCKKMAPIVDNLAQELGDEVDFVKLNASNEAFDMAQATKMIGGKPVQSVPTFILAKEGKEIGRFVGAYSPEAFKDKINSVFKLP